jgi:DNA-binding response OmpR family regulator
MRLLIVEDDTDGREMLVELFRMHRWDVTPVDTTTAAMTELRKSRFDLVVTDENLSGRSGSSMLREAAAQGLLFDVAVMMYTAELGDLDVPSGVRVLRKPFGIKALLDIAKTALRARRRSTPSLVDKLECKSPPSSQRL